LFCGVGLVIVLFFLSSFGNYLINLAKVLALRLLTRHPERNG
jgi:hypothetical protein